MEPFRHHVFVCTQEKPEGVTSCPSGGSWPILRELEQELILQGLDDEVQVTTCGCLSLCDDGPVMVVYPGGVWYHMIKADDVHEIVKSHLRGGQVVSRLVWSDDRAMKTQAIEHRNHYRAIVKARDEAGTLPDNLNDMIRGYQASRTVLTALELDVFSSVGEGECAECIARKIHADSRATEMLLNALVSLKLLSKSNGTFFNTAASQRFFAKGSRDDARPGLLHLANIWHNWSNLTDSVRAGTAVHGNDHKTRQVEDFITAMDRNAKERAGAVVKAVGTTGIKRMLDLGGGSGAYSIAFAAASPEVHSDIVDLEDVLPLTKEYVKNSGVADRIRMHAGDMLHDSLGKDYDLVLVCAVCHMFSPNENRELFRRAYEALAPHGQIVLQDFILDASKTSPRAAALFSLNMLVGTKAGSSYSEPEFASWLREAGFSDLRRVNLPGPSALMIGNRA
jgi:3-hydroxy-5-methyl-1-naphthoate 3-O-methyltransferase